MCCFKKHSIVFSIRQVIVIGPTPPGTGVIALTLYSTLSKSTSPTSFPSTLFTPTSMIYTVSYQQLNYLYQMLKNEINNEESNAFMQALKPALFQRLEQ